MVKKSKVSKVAATVAASTLALGTLGLVTPAGAADAGYTKLGTGMDIRSTLSTSTDLEIEKTRDKSYLAYCNSINEPKPSEGKDDTASNHDGKEDHDKCEDVSSYAHGKGRHYRYNNSSGKSSLDRNSSRQTRVWE